MNLEQAIAHAEDGGRATCDLLPLGAVLKLENVGEWPKPTLRVVFEGTGDGYNFTARDEHQSATWRKVEGWASYVRS